MRNHSYENEFDLHENEPTGRTHFHVKGFAFRLILIQRQKVTQKWSIGSPAHNALKEVAWKPELLKDIHLLADFVQTGCLEVFHGSMARKYANKLQHYS